MAAARYMAILAWRSSLAGDEADRNHRSIDADRLKSCTGYPHGHSCDSLRSAQSREVAANWLLRRLLSYSQSVAPDQSPPSVLGLCLSRSGMSKATQVRMLSCRSHKNEPPFRHTQKTSTSNITVAVGRGPDQHEPGRRPWKWQK